MGTHVGTVLLERLIFPQIIDNILFFLWNPQIYYCVQNNPLLIHIPSQMNLVHTLPPHSSKNNCNITPSMPTSSNWHLPFSFYSQNSGCTTNISHTCYVPPQFILLDLII